MNNDRPDIHMGLLWDTDLQNFDFRQNYLKVIERVSERGTDEEWSEIMRFYGEPKVRQALMTEVKYLHNYAIDRVCELLSCNKEELLCYTRKQSKRGHFL